jgi:Bacteriophage translational regulator
MIYFIKIGLKKDIGDIEELLERIGLQINNNIYQTCHVLEINDIFYLIHFKEFFSLYSYLNSNKIEVNKIKMDEEDVIRRNNIILQLYNEEYITLNKKIKIYLEENNGPIDYITIPQEDKKLFKYIKKVKF